MVSHLIGSFVKNLYTIFFFIRFPITFFLIGYFGNAIFFATQTVPTKDLLSESLAKTVERIHKAINQMNDDYLRSGIDYLEELNLSNKPMELAERTLLVNSWVRLPIACTDFGWGKTTCMRPTRGVDDLPLSLPSYSGDEDLSLFVCSQDEHIKWFEKLLYVLE